MNTRRRKPAPVPHLRPAAARRRRSGLGAARRQRWARALGARWPLIRRWLLGAFLLLVAVLIVIQAREVEWDQVLHAMASYRAPTLLKAAAFAAVGYLAYSGYDLLARPFGERDPAAGRIMTVTFVSYAFNLNLGSFIGGAGFRYRLYSKLGVDNPAVTRVLALSLVTNWLGYLWLAGAAFAAGTLRLPEGWILGSGALRGIGVALLAVALGYLAVCARARRRSWTFKGHGIELPTLPVALMQSVLATTSWAAMGGVVYVLLPGELDYPVVLTVLLLSSIASAFTHVPAGLGVIEAVFLALLGTQESRFQLLGALLTYRAIYYLFPLLIATVVYAGLEASWKRGRRGAAASPGT